MNRSCEFGCGNPKYKPEIWWIAFCLLWQLRSIGAGDDGYRGAPEQNGDRLSTRNLFARSRWGLTIGRVNVKLKLLE
ncbi:MAG: hypothetical protein SWY16_22575 [Cyanobacteriota bacterium]|nr:hypothetical protein [Cyanobacteriota bacterium]